MDFGYKIEKHLGVFADKKNGYTKEVNVVSWGEYNPQIDIRMWKNIEGDKMPCKGISLSRDEAEKVVLLLRDALT